MTTRVDWRSIWPSDTRPSTTTLVARVLVTRVLVAGVLVAGVTACSDPEDVWSERVTLDDTPGGFTLSAVFASADLEGAGGDGTAIVLRAPDATWDDGRWIAVVAVPEGPETAGLDPDLEFPGEDRQVIEIAGVPAAVGTTYDERPGVVLGPIDGHLVSLVGHDVDLVELQDAAADVDVIDGVPSIGDAGDLELIAVIEHATVDAATSIVSATLAPGEGSATVAFQPDLGTTPLQVSNRPASDQTERLLDFLLGPGARTEVRDRDGWAERFTLADYSLNVVAWVEAGRQISVASELPLDQLIGYAYTVGEVSPERWEELRAEARAFFER
jgi:hypothetical protein